MPIEVDGITSWELPFLPTGNWQSSSGVCQIIPGVNTCLTSLLDIVLSTVPAIVEVIVMDVEVNVSRVSCQLRAFEISCQYEHRKELQTEANVITHWELEFTNWEMIFMFRWFLARFLSKPGDEICM